MLLISCIREVFDINIGGIIYESLNDGVGVRTVVFVSGCKRNCKGCHNERVCDFDYGVPFTFDVQQHIIDYLNKDPLIQGLTLSGGDPFYSEKEIADFLKKTKEQTVNKDVWIYTGFLFEEIQHSPILKYTNVLVDGAYIEQLRDTNLKYRGSSNQRIIDVKKTIQKGEVVLYDC